jgi:serine/threonine-protein kinase
MEYLEGRDLKAELEARGTLPIREAVTHVLQAAAGLAEAHALGIVHRDVKPSNLFLSRLPNGRSIVKVLDFGIAKQTAHSGATELTHTFSVLGSAPYMSPEQVRAAKNVDARTDVWSLGAVLFQLLTGRVPFEADTVTAIAAAIIADPPAELQSLRPDVPAELEAAVMGCLEKKADQRIASLAVLASRLAPFAGPGGDVYAARAAQALNVAVPPRPLLASVPELSAESAQPIAPARVAGVSKPATAPPISPVPEKVPAIAETIPTSDVRDATRSNWVDTASRSIRKRVGKRPRTVAGAVAIGLVAVAGLWKALSSAAEDKTAAGAASVSAEPAVAAVPPTSTDRTVSATPSSALSVTPVAAPAVLRIDELKPDKGVAPTEVAEKADVKPSAASNKRVRAAPRPAPANPPAASPPPAPAPQKPPRTTADDLVKRKL